MFCNYALSEETQNFQEFCNSPWLAGFSKLTLYNVSARALLNQTVKNSFTYKPWSQHKIWKGAGPLQQLFCNSSQGSRHQIQAKIYRNTYNVIPLKPLFLDNWQRVTTSLTTISLGWHYYMKTFSFLLCNYFCHNPLKKSYIETQHQFADVLFYKEFSLNNLNKESPLFNDIY